MSERVKVFVHFPARLVQDRNSRDERGFEFRIENCEKLGVGCKSALLLLIFSTLWILDGVCFTTVANIFLPTFVRKGELNRDGLVSGHWYFYDKLTIWYKRHVKVHRCRLLYESLTGALYLLMVWWSGACTSGRRLTVSQGVLLFAAMQCALEVNLIQKICIFAFELLNLLPNIWWSGRQIWRLSNLCFNISSGKEESVKRA